MTFQKAPENEGWQDRVAQIPEAVIYPVAPTSQLWTFLNHNDMDKVIPKLLLVWEAANLIARAMVKGTLKYTTDDHPIEVWEDMGLDDHIDSLCYRMLERKKRQEDRDDIAALISKIYIGDYQYTNISEALAAADSNDIIRVVPKYPEQDIING